MFLSMPLGVSGERFGVPFVLDIQDPWLSDYYETHPEATAPPNTRGRIGCTACSNHGRWQRRQG